DQVVGVAAGQDLLGIVGGGAQHAHGMVVGQQDVANGLVADFADASDHVLGHYRGGLRVYHHDGFVADDDAGVGIALGGVGVGVVGQFFEGDDLVFQVVVRGEGLAHEKDSTVREDILRLVYG